MGEARRRGSFADRKVEAIVTGRIPEKYRQAQRASRAYRFNYEREYLAFIRALLKSKEALQNS